MKPKIYIAGPYSCGDVMQNIRKALEAAEVIWGLGAVAYVPHLTGFWHLIAPHSYNEWLTYDFEWLAACDAVFRLLGDSPGADRECDEARRLGRPVFVDWADLEQWINTKALQ